MAYRLNRRDRLPMIRWSGLASCCIAAAVASGSEMSPSRLEIFPHHTQLRVGEQIHYSVFQQEGESLKKVGDYSLVPDDPSVVRVVDLWRLEAVSAGRTEVLVSSASGQRRLTIDVGPEPMPSMPAVHHSEVERLTGEELLFVGHANLDGFDHTGVAKAGVDRLVREFKARGKPVMYFVSEEYPHWYTEDREPDLAIVSEGQEHTIVVDAERIVFSGGDFLICTLRNAQMTLHGMLKAAKRDRIHFVLATDAIWAVDRFTPGHPRPYPAPMALVERLLLERSSERQRYEQVVIPFLDALVGVFPVLDYPPVAPEPPLEKLLDGWTIEVTLDGTFRQTYRAGNPDKVVHIEFVSGRALWN